MGVICVMTAGPGVTENAFAKVTTSLPVVTVKLRELRNAVGSIFRTAVVLVGEFTVNDATVIPAPKFAVVVP